MPRKTMDLSILPPEFKITAINNTGDSKVRAKARIYLMPDTPLMPVSRLVGVKVKPIPRALGVFLIVQTLTATSWNDLKRVVRRLWLVGYDWDTYTIRNLRQPVELFILKTPDGKMFINAVEQSRRPRRLVYYTSFPTTQKILAIIIAENITDAVGIPELENEKGEKGKPPFLGFLYGLLNERDPEND